MLTCSRNPTALDEIFEKVRHESFNHLKNERGLAHHCKWEEGTCRKAYESDADETCSQLDTQTRCLGVFRGREPDLQNFDLQQQLVADVPSSDEVPAWETCNSKCNEQPDRCDAFSMTPTAGEAGKYHCHMYKHKSNHGVVLSEKPGSLTSFREGSSFIYNIA